MFSNLKRPPGKASGPQQLLLLQTTEIPSARVGNYTVFPEIIFYTRFFDLKKVKSTEQIEQSETRP